MCSNGDDDVASIKCNYSWKYIFLGFLSIEQFSFVQVNLKRNPVILNFEDPKWLFIPWKCKIHNWMSALISRYIFICLVTLQIGKSAFLLIVEGFVMVKENWFLRKLHENKKTQRKPFVNFLNSESDQHLVSLYHYNAESLIKIMSTKEMISNLSFHF